MKKTILYFIGLVAGNFLVVKFAFAQDDTRFLDIFGVVVGLFCIFPFSAKLAGLILKRDFSFSDIASERSMRDKSNIKPAYITLIILIILIGLHIGGYKCFFAYQDELLAKNGIPAKAVITNKKWEFRGKNLHSEYFIYYEYKHNGKLYKHNIANQIKEIGDTITVKFLPNNPDNHSVIQFKTEK